MGPEQGQNRALWLREASQALARLPAEQVAPVSRRSSQEWQAHCSFDLCENIQEIPAGMA